MKKLLSLALALVALAAFVDLGAAQQKGEERKIGPMGGMKKAEEKPAAIPPPFQLTLSPTPNAAAKGSCPVTARLSAGSLIITFPNKTVTFEVVDGPQAPPPLPSGVTNTKSEVYIYVQRGQTVRAKQSDYHYQLTSNDFYCPDSSSYPSK